MKCDQKLIEQSSVSKYTQASNELIH